MKKLFFIIAFLSLFSITLVSANGINPSAEGETNTQTIAAIIIGALFSSLIPLVLGYLTFYEMEKRIIFSKSSRLYPG